ncbi:MAG: glycosyltransferase family 2 protein [Planctomycetes bacterium]|nr:glycosyltransferase family 2 protein [Planctomycetota bacterium]
MTPADCSVIVVSWNTRDLLEACLASVRDRAPGAETIVVDNDSADGSAAMVRAKFPEATLLENASNRGFARAVNQGLDRAARPVAVLLNPDATLSDGALEELLRAMEADPGIGIAGAQLLDADGRRQHSFDNFPTLATECLNKWLVRALFPGRFPDKSRALDAVTDVESVIGACLAVRKETVDRLGPLDEAYFVFLEETDWCLRMRRAGLRVVHVPAARVFHRQGKSKAVRPVLARIEYLRSLFLYFRKNRGPAAWALLHAARFAKSFLNALGTSLALILTLGLSGAVRRRAAIHAGLFGWQLMGCPDSIGLRPPDLPPARPLRAPGTLAGARP